jgi:hypothetical protein
MPTHRILIASLHWQVREETYSGSLEVGMMVPDIARGANLKFTQRDFGTLIHQYTFKPAHIH